MRRTEQNLGEKRVLLGSLSKKNNLRKTYERLNLEEKAFISSTKFNRRQLLSRHTKLRQLQTQGSKELNQETRPKNRMSFPGLPGANESLIRSYSNNLTLPYSRNGLRNTGEGKRISSSVGKEESIEQMKSHKSQSNMRSNVLDFKDVSTEKRNEMKISMKQKSAKVERDSKSKQIQESGLHVGDIIAYSASFDRREKRKKASSVDREDLDTAGKQISEVGSFDHGKVSR
jgi:hypothetical protein